MSDTRPTSRNDGSITVAGYSFHARIMGVPEYPSRSFQHEDGRRTVPWEDWADMQRRLKEAVEVIANLQVNASVSEKPAQLTGNPCFMCDGTGRQPTYKEVMATVMPEPQAHNYAPPGKLWQCGACGKITRDQYGEEGGWDESCMLNSFLIDEPKGAK